MTKVFSVSELNRLVAQKLKMDPVLSEAQVRGEISEFKVSANGHLYMTLKDHAASLSCVMFKRDLLSQEVSPKRGLEMTLTGSCNLYEADGRYQFIARRMTVEGEGALHQKFLDLKDRLDKEGLFAAERKRSLPKFPGRVALITSPTGAVLRDFVTTARKLHAAFDILLIPALVQGELAPASLLQAIELASRRADIDIVVLARGGGSFSDLNCFNDEALARAIARCPKIVVSAIGHETDFTIADFVADWRSATPTAAAKDIYPDWRELAQRIDAEEARLWRIAAQQLRTSGSELRRWQESLNRALASRWQASKTQLREVNLRLRFQNQGELKSLQNKRQSFAIGHLEAVVSRHIWAGRRAVGLQEQALKRAGDDALTSATEAWSEALRGLELGIHQKMQRDVNHFKLLETRLQGLSPLRILERGYAIALDSQGEALTHPEDISDGSSFQVVLAHGKMLAEKRQTIAEEKGQIDV